MLYYTKGIRPGGASSSPGRVLSGFLFVPRERESLCLRGGFRYMRNWFRKYRTIVFSACLLTSLIAFMAAVLFFAFPNYQWQDMDSPAAAASLGTTPGWAPGWMRAAFEFLNLRLLYAVTVTGVIVLALVFAGTVLRSRLHPTEYLTALDIASYCTIAVFCCLCQSLALSDAFREKIQGVSMLGWAIVYMPVFWIASREGWEKSRWGVFFRLWTAVNVMAAALALAGAHSQKMDSLFLSDFLLLLAYSLWMSARFLWSILREKNWDAAFRCLAMLSMIFVSVMCIRGHLLQDGRYIGAIQTGILCGCLLFCMDGLWSSWRSGSLSMDGRREQEYRLIAQYIGRYLLRYDFASRTLYCHDETLQLLDLPPVLSNAPECLMQWEKILPRSRQSWQELWRGILAGEKGGGALIGYAVSEKEELWLRADFVTSMDERGEPSFCVLSLHADEEARSRKEAYLRRQAENELLLEQGAVCYEIDLNADRLTSAKGEPFFGAEETPGNVKELLLLLQKRLNQQKDAQRLETTLNVNLLLRDYLHENREHSVDFQRATEEGPRWTRLVAKLVGDPYSDHVLGQFLLRDVEEERRNAPGEEKGRRDELTGLLGRSAFAESVDRLFRNSAPEACHVVYMIDLDGFKAVNDAFGHSFGDRVLAEAASGLRQLFREGDMVCRFGGDEFIVCMRDTPNDEDFVLKRGFAVCDALARQFDQNIVIGASVGAAIYPFHGKTLKELFQRADQALYRAKNSGRNRCLIHDPAVDSSRFPQQEEKLFVPDEPAASKLLMLDDGRFPRETLGEEYETLDAASPDEVVELLQERGDEIALTIVNGLEKKLKDGRLLLKALQEDPDCAAVPVQVICELEDEEEIASALRMGVEDFIALPCPPALARLRMKNAILRRESAVLRQQNRSLMIQQAGRVRHQQQLQYMAERDSVTHIYNKNAFLRYTQILLEKNTEEEYSVASLDIARFRAVNDVFGYEEGDRLLRYVAVQLQRAVGTEGTYARTANDHFVLCVRSSRLENMLEQINRRMEEYDLRFLIRLCAGVFRITDRSLSVQQMLDRAQMAARSVKGSYVQTVGFYDESMSVQFLEEQRILNDMKGALENGDFKIYLQPKCRLDTGKIVGAEALVRWEHPQRGMLRPDAFIPIFERNGFIMQLDEYVWEQACRFQQGLMQTHPEIDLPVSVNISRVDLYNPRLCDTLCGLCKRYGIPSRRMEVEITESSYVEDAQMLRSLTERLHALGFVVEMDDFGSGYSSLNMLNEIPVDVLKLDMRFLYGVQQNKRSFAILKSIVSMSRDLNLKVIAEGVETEAQARFLAGVGCKSAQGYYYHRPMRTEEFLRLLEKEAEEEEQSRDEEGARLYLSRLLAPALLLRQRETDMELLCCNDYYYQMIHITSENFSRSDRNLYQWIDEKDQADMREAMNRARALGRPQSCRYVRRDLKNQYHLLEASVIHVAADKDPNLFIFILEEKG